MCEPFNSKCPRPLNHCLPSPHPFFSSSNHFPVHVTPVDRLIRRPFVRQRLGIVVRRVLPRNNVSFPPPPPSLPLPKPPSHLCRVPSLLPHPPSKSLFTFSTTTPTPFWPFSVLFCTHTHASPPIHTHPLTHPHTHTHKYAHVSERPFIVLNAYKYT